MTDDLAIRLTRVLGHAARAVITCAAMHTENVVRAANGKPYVYGEKQFRDLIDDNGLGWNDIITETRP